MKRILPLPLLLGLSGCATFMTETSESPPVGMAAVSGLSADPAFALSSDDAGSVVLAYAEGSSILAQRYGADGAPAWPAPGVLVASGTTEVRGLVLDRGMGGWYAAWKEREALGWRVKVRWFSDVGEAAWESPALAGMLSSGRFPLDYTAMADGSMVLAYNDRNRLTQSIFLGLSRVMPDGKVSWTRELGNASQGAWYQAPKLDWDEAEGFYLSYRMFDQGDRGLVMQRFSGAGEPLWPEPLDVYDAGGYKSPALMFSDRHGGGILAWEDGRSSSMDVYAQRVSSSGALLWRPEGLAIGWGDGNQWDPVMCPDGLGGAYVAWVDEARTFPWNVKVQHLSGQGELSYPPAGLAAVVSVEHQSHPMIAMDGANGAVVCWYEARGRDYGIYCQRVGPKEGVLWGSSGVTVTDSHDQKTGWSIAADGKGGAVVAWKSQMEGGWEIRARRLEDRKSVV